MIGLLLAAVVAAPGQHWPAYVNVRFGYAICYPHSLRRGREADNSGGVTFTDSNGARLSVFGHYDTDETGLAEAVLGDAKSRIDAGATITLNRHGKRWAVLSGLDRGDVFYEKIIQRDDRLATFVLTYPQAQAVTYDPMAARLNRCFEMGTVSF